MKILIFKGAYGLMCDACDFCGEAGLDTCIVCGRCYCFDHMGGDGYCVDCFFGSGLFK
ncbi:MAG: hypothetical protein Q4P17_10595 [Methanobacterium sp.]|nr:hypothetical protein [Methanobacterium sp.]